MVEAGAAVDGGRRDAVSDDRAHIEGNGAHVKQHSGDVNERGEKK